MTRIRKNWSSSRSTEHVGSQFSHAAIANDSHKGATKGKLQPPITLQLVDQGTALDMLAGVSLESLDQISGIRNLTRENVSSQVMVAVEAKSLERDPDMQNVNHERASPKVWEQSYSQGSSRSKRSSKSDHCYQKPSAQLWNSDHGPASALPKKVSTRRDTVDEQQSKSSSVADNEVVDSDFSARMSDLSARVERAKRGLVGVEPMQGLISGSLLAHRSEREPSNQEASRVLQEPVFGHSTERKRRQQPSESELQNLPAIAVDGCRTDQKTQKPVNREDRASGGDIRRLKIIFKAPQDQGTCEGHQIRAESANVGADNGNVNRDEPGLKPEKVLTEDSERNEQKAQSEEVGEDIDERNKLNVKVEKVGNAVDDRTKQREKSPEAGTNVGDRTRWVRAKTQTVESDAPQNSTGGDIFPKEWKYRGLLQIAGKDEVTNGPVKKLCIRTDGHNWRCPLRAVEGSSLCQHHVNKVQAKIMGKRNKRKAESEKESDEALVNSHASDLAASFEPSLPSEHRVPTKLPRSRRYKTAKLSVLGMCHQQLH